MEQRAKRELSALVCIVLIFAILGLYSIIHARTVVRDNLRKEDITNLKHALEQYNNLHTFYVSSPHGKLGCTTSSGDSWFFGEDSPLLKEQFIDAIPHDVREEKGLVYSYCITHMNKKVATGFYLQSALEANTPEGIFFDEDEERKFDYRVLREGDKLLYRVCGGEEEQCKKHL